MSKRCPPGRTGPGQAKGDRPGDDRFGAYLGAFINLNPLLELDGYFILIDWLEIPMLRQRSLDYWRTWWNAWLRGGWSFVLRPIDEHRLRLQASIPEMPIYALADATRMEQVLVNLLSNAAKYTPENQLDQIVSTFLSTPFDGGRHERRVEKIEKEEEQEGR